MKILQVVPYFYPAWAYGGPAKLVYDTSKYFAKLGHDVTVYTSDSFDQTNRMPKNKYVTNIPHLNIRYFKNLNNHLAYVYNIFITPGIILKSLTEFHKFDVIHIHDFYTTQNIWVVVLSILYRKPYILSVHGCLEEKRITQRSLFKKMFLLFFGRNMLRKASLVIATSPNEVIAYKEYLIPESKIVSSGHGIDPSEFITEATKLQSRKRFHLNQNDTVVTFLGRIHQIKGLDNLIKAIRIIKDKKIHFVIAGSNDGYLLQLKGDIKKYNLSNRITLLGTCFGEEKSQLFKASDVFIYPSYSEGFSLGVLEAAAAGLPLIITTGCHFDQVGKQKAGIVVPPDDKKIAFAIEKLGTDSLLRQKLGENAKKLICSQYSMEAIGNRFLSLYKKVSRVYT